MTAQWRRAIGMMSGTSMDGVDAAIIETDGENIRRLRFFVSLPYSDDLRSNIRKCLKITEADSFENKVARDLTLVHINAVNMVLQKSGFNPDEIDVIGFHGQTVWHDPDNGLTRQIGDPGLLARETGINVVADLRLDDVASGGQGAPLAPIYHAALLRSLDVDYPVAVVNIGGVSNVTWIGSTNIKEDQILAFDCGPGNAQLDDWMLEKTGQAFDEGGKICLSGQADPTVELGFLEHPYFDKLPPKSLDRLDMEKLQQQLMVKAGPGIADGAASLATCCVAAIVAGVNHMPVAPHQWFVTGGGRHNKFIMEQLRVRLNVSVESVDVLDWDGDALEAECFAFLAVRHMAGLPISFPGTTGVAMPCKGGRFYEV